MYYIVYRSSINCLLLYSHIQQRITMRFPAPALPTEEHTSGPRETVSRVLHRLFAMPPLTIFRSTDQRDTSDKGSLQYTRVRRILNILFILILIFLWIAMVFLFLPRGWNWRDAAQKTGHLVDRSAQRAYKSLRSIHRMPRACSSLRLGKHQYHC